MAPETGGGSGALEHDRFTGLVRVLPRRGVVVCAISAGDMREIYEVIIALESAAAELLAERPSKERLSIAQIGSRQQGDGKCFEDERSHSMGEG